MSNKNLENSIKNTADLIAKEKEGNSFEAMPDSPSLELEEKKKVIIENAKEKIKDNLKHIHDDFQIGEEKLEELYTEFSEKINSKKEKHEISEPVNLKKEIHDALEEAKQIEIYTTAFWLANQKA